MFTKDKNKRAAIAAIIIVSIIAMSCVLYLFTDVVKFKDEQSTGINGIGNLTSNTALDVTYPTSGALGQFADGYSYVFTDKDKVNDFRAGNIDYDLTNVKVDATQPHGSQRNPYVIASVDDWTIFAKNLDNGIIPSYGNGKYFALANDIDFSSKTFRPIRFFNGTFYGIGYKLKNITITGADWLYWNGSSYVAIPTVGTAAPLGYGLFCRTTGAVIADVILEKFSYQDMPNYSSGSSMGMASAGIIGRTAGNDVVLNCHIMGEIKSPNVRYTGYSTASGIAGFKISDATSLLVYRCSAELTTEVNFTNTAYCQFSGGIFGGTQGASGALTFYDCVANITAIVQTSRHQHIGGLLGLIWQGSSLVNVENAIVSVNLNSTILSSSGALGCIWSGPQTSMVNCYASGETGLEDSKVSMYPFLKNDTGVMKNIKNVNSVKKSTDYAVSGNGSQSMNAFAGSSEWKEYDSKNYTNPELSMFNAAKTFFSTSPYSNIWDASKIGGYTPDTSPVRNYLAATVTFRNLTGGGASEEQLGIDTADYMPGMELPEPDSAHTKTNHEFKGWTMDKSGESEPFRVLPSGVFGEVTFYAVWGVDVKENTDITASGGTATTGGYSATAEYGEVIKLQSKVTCSVMSDLEYKVQWKKGSDEVKNVTSKEYNVRNVRQSGEYTFDYVFYSKEEPLWRGKGTATKTYSVEIKPATLSVKRFETTLPPYKGRPYSDGDFKPKAVIEDKKGNIVDGTSEWAIQLGTVGSGSGNESIDGEQITNKFNFKPDEKYEGNYGETVLLDGVYDMQYVQLIFKMPKLSNETMEVDLEYGIPYKYKTVADLFQEAFKKYMTDPKYSKLFEGLTPAFLVNGSNMNINDYKAQSGNAYAEVTDNIEITVDFVNGEYTVKYDPNNGEGITTLANKVKYNIPLVKPEPDPVGANNELFMGWYYDTGEKDAVTQTAIMKKWDFEKDRVTGDITLVAQWLAADRLTSLTATVRPGVKLIAGNKISDGDLIVNAHFEGTVNGETIEQSMELTWADYKDTLEYDVRAKDEKLHVFDLDDKTNLIKLKYTFTNNKGATYEAECEVSVKVEQIDMTKELHDVNNLDFGQDGDNRILMEADGTVKNLPELVSSQYGKYNVKSISYEYILDGVTVDATEVIAAGEYTVRVEFEMKTNDYYAKALILTLVLGELTEVDIVWDYDEASPYLYNTEVQAPTAKAYTSNGTQLNVEIKYGMDTEKSAVGKYVIKASIEGDYKIVSGETCNYEITKATLNIPTLKEDSEIVYDGEAKSVEKYLEGYDGKLMSIASGGSGTDAGSYTSIIELPDTVNCQWSGISGKTVTVEWEIGKAHLTAVWSGYKHVANGEEFQPKVTGFVGLAEVDANAVNYETDITYSGDIGKKEVGAYSITAILNASAQWSGNYIMDSNTTRSYAIIPQEGLQVITIEWEESELIFNGKVQMPSYKVLDENGNDITEQVKGILKFGGDYDKSKWADDYTLTVEQPSSGYYIMSGLSCEYTITLDANGNGYNPNPDEDKEEDKDGGISFENVGEMLKQWWQVIASGVSIVLLIIFTTKGIGYAGNKKKAKKTKESKYSEYYAAGATGLFGLAMSAWTAIACVMMGLAVASFVFMLLEKKAFNKAQEELEEAKEQYIRNQSAIDNNRRDDDYRRREEEMMRRDEEMRNMFMHMMGGNVNGGNMGQGMPQGSYMGGGYGIGVEEMRGLISDTVTALLPGMQQMLPQQASYNDELVQKLIEKSEKNDEAMQKMMEKSQRNEEEMRDLIRKLAEQSTEKVVEREVAATSANDETIKQIINSQEKFMERSQKQDETISQLMEKILELSANQNVQPQLAQVQPQIIEKIVEVPVEKIVEKEVKVEVPVEVEKIVEKEIRVEVPVEKVVEKVVEKEVKVSAPAKAPKEKAPRLTLDEAYEKLTKQQKKFFDGLREYAKSKDKCKEKKSTYFIVLGQSSVNPLIKLTVKKDTTVALFKMEDEYLKDIRRNAGSDGTKVKVKETEVIIGDAQAYATAKEMIDLREDQIERYAEYLKEQKAMR